MRRSELRRADAFWADLVGGSEQLWFAGEDLDRVRVDGHNPFLGDRPGDTWRAIARPGDAIAAVGLRDGDLIVGRRRHGGWLCVPANRADRWMLESVEGSIHLRPGTVVLRRVAANAGVAETWDGIGLGAVEAGPAVRSIDWVNPYLSPLRQFVCRKLEDDFPSPDEREFCSVGSGKAVFEKWTRWTQARLEAQWRQEGFAKNAKGAWERTDLSKKAVTTSCEALIGVLIDMVRGLPEYAVQKARSPLGSFDLPGCKGNEPAQTVGWHWFRDRDKPGTRPPSDGDFFQYGVPAGKKWGYRHVGVIRDFSLSDYKAVWSASNPAKWTTVEAGRGGPGRGFDCIARTKTGPVQEKRPDGAELMGWLNIDEYFAAYYGPKP